MTWPMKRFFTLFTPLAVLTIVACLFFLGCSGDKTITLRGASQFDKNHAYSKTLERFVELVKEYYAQPVEFEIYLNSELGLEKDYFSYMSQGLSVDFAVVSPSHMSTFSKAAPLMDMPFLFRDLAHWNKVLNGDALQPIADQISEKADVNFIENTILIYENTLYKNPRGVIKTDNIKIDLTTKNVFMFMNDSKNKVKVKSN